MFHLPENTSFDEFVITVCLDILNVAFFFSRVSLLLMIKRNV